MVTIFCESIKISNHSFHINLVCFVITYVSCRFSWDSLYNMVTCPDFAVIFAVLIIDYKF